jgi:hypothetical protein
MLVLFTDEDKVVISSNQMAALIPSMDDVVIVQIASGDTFNVIGTVEKLTELWLADLKDPLAIRFGPKGDSKAAWTT